MYEYQNIKIFLQKVTLQIGEKKFSVIKRFKILRWTYVINEFYVISIIIIKLPSCSTTIKLLVYGDDSLDLVTNTLIFNSSADLRLSSK